MIICYEISQIIGDDKVLIKYSLRINMDERLSSSLINLLLTPKPYLIVEIFKKKTSKEHVRKYEAKDKLVCEVK